MLQHRSFSVTFETFFIKTFLWNIPENCSFTYSIKFSKQTPFFIGTSKITPIFWNIRERLLLPLLEINLESLFYFLQRRKYLSFPKCWKDQSPNKLVLMCAGFPFQLEYLFLVHLSLQKQPSEVICKKKVLLEISQNSQENTCARVPFLNKVVGLGLSATASVINLLKVTSSK